MVDVSAVLFRPQNHREFPAVRRVRVMITARIAAVCVLTILSGAEARAQQFFAPEPPPDVLSPSPRQWWIGPLIGVDVTTQHGTFAPVLCKECSFSDGSGTGAEVGVEYGHRINGWIGYAVRGAYEDRSAKYSTPLPNVGRIVLDPTTGDTSTVLVGTERTSTVDVSYLVLHPMVLIFPVADLYLTLGVGIGVRMTSRYDVHERLVDEGFVYYENGTNTVTLEDKTDLPDPESVRFDTRAGIGYDIRLSETVTLTPEASYDFPLTKIWSRSDWTAQSWHFIVIMKFAL
jgi:hypothetical protein